MLKIGQHQLSAFSPRSGCWFPFSRARNCLSIRQRLRRCASSRLERTWPAAPHKPGVCFWFPCSSKRLSTRHTHKRLSGQALVWCQTSACPPDKRLSFRHTHNLRHKHLPTTGRQALSACPPDRGQAKRLLSHLSTRHPHKRLSTRHAPGKRLPTRQALVHRLPIRQRFRNRRLPAPPGQGRIARKRRRRSGGEGHPPRCIAPLEAARIKFSVASRAVFSRLSRSFQSPLAQY